MLSKLSQSCSRHVNKAVLLQQINKQLNKAANTSTRSFHTITKLNKATSSLIKSCPSTTQQFTRCFAVETVKVPSLGDSISEGTLVKWQKGVGERVERDEVLVVIETDKVSVDIRSPTSGIVKTQAAKEGQTIKVGEELGKSLIPQSAI
jgi:biotin carboxyl carrier protein